VPGSPSSIGWGLQPFGQFPFGTADWHLAAFLPLVPEIHRTDDLTVGGRVALPLLTFLNALKPNMNELEQKWRDFPDLWSADDCPVDQLRLLAATLGLELSTDKSELFQRLEIINLPQVIINKGTDLGYRIAGAFEGLEGTVTGLWAETCEPGAALSDVGPNSWFASFDDGILDSIPLDSIYTDRLAIWPRPLFPIADIGALFFDTTPLDIIPLDSGLSIVGGRCRAHTIRLFYQKPDDTEIEGYNDSSPRVVRFVERFRPEHVTIDSIKFDGPKASATWVNSIVADASAAVSWTTDITQAALASVTWTTAIDITP